MRKRILAKKLSKLPGIRRKSHLVLLGITGITLASCGSTSLASSKASTSTTAATSTASYRSCLAAHGLTFPKYDPSQKNPPTTVSISVRQAAIAACTSGTVRPQASFSGQRKAMRSYLSCLSSHGVTLPTTTTAAGSSGNVGRSAFGGIRNLQQQPGFVAAAQQCASLKPKFTRGPGSKFSPSTTTVG